MIIHFLLLILIFNHFMDYIQNIHPFNIYLNVSIYIIYLNTYYNVYALTINVYSTEPSIIYSFKLSNHSI